MKGKTVVATGATSGIGEVAALALARMGARIVFVARDDRRAETALSRLEAQAPRLRPSRAPRRSLAHGGDAARGRGDRQKRASHRRAHQQRRRPVRRAAGDVRGSRTDLRAQPHGLFRVDGGARRSLAASAPARIVSTSSMAHQGVSLDFSDLQCARGYNGWKAYGRSKLANILFTRELARRLAGRGVTANCLHPGFVATRFGDASGGWTSRLMPLMRTLRRLSRAGRRYDHPPRLVA